jgi:hypothetical protein
MASIDRSGRPHQQEELDLHAEDPQSARRGITDPTETERRTLPLLAAYLTRRRTVSAAGVRNGRWSW